MQMIRLIQDTIIECAIKPFAGGGGGEIPQELQQWAMESEEEYAAFVLSKFCIVILKRLHTRYRYVWSWDWLLRRQQLSTYYTILQELDR